MLAFRVSFLKVKDSSLCGLTNHQVKVAASKFKAQLTLHLYHIIFVQVIPPGVVVLIAMLLRLQGPEFMLETLRRAVGISILH